MNQNVSIDLLMRSTPYKAAERRRTFRTITKRVIVLASGDVVELQQFFSRCEWYVKYKCFTSESEFEQSPSTTIHCSDPCHDQFTFGDSSSSFTFGVHHVVWEHEWIDIKGVCAVAVRLKIQVPIIRVNRLWHRQSSQHAIVDLTNKCLER